MPNSSHNHNPNGHNQHGEKLKKDDPVLVDLLRGYHEELMTSNEEISKRLAAEHQIHLRQVLGLFHASSVKRARKFNNFIGGAANLESKSLQDAQQLVLDQLDQDPSNHAGPRTIRHRIANRKGEHLPRDFVHKTMQLHAPEGFQQRNPGSRRIIRVQKVPLGIHERWSCDGHDKLYRIGFPVYGIVDDATGRWLDAWVVPSNRFGHVIAYLFLCCVEKYGGIPLQVSTDCGSETTLVYGLMNALREIFHGDMDINELPAHIYLRSVHNISIERAWLRLRLEWGDNAVLTFEKGEDEGWYDSQDENHQQLCRWLWAKLLTKSLKRFMKERNAYKSRKDTKKAGPSGVTRNAAFSMPEAWGGKNCLLPVDVDVIREIKKEMGGDEILEFVPKEFAERAEAAYLTLCIEELTYDNSKPQCSGCGLVWSRMKAGGLCNGCTAFYRNASLIPREILANPDALKCLQECLTEDNDVSLSDSDTSGKSSAEDHHDSLQSLASDVLSRAKTHRAHASNTRIKAGPPKTVQSTSSKNKHNNINRANQVNEGRRQKKAEAILRNEQRGITILASLWQYDSRSKLVAALPPIQVQRTFDEVRVVKKCLDDLLVQVQADFGKAKPQAPPLTWENVQLLADVGSVNNWASLSHLDREQSLKEWFQEFKKQKYATSANLEKSTIKIRFAYGNKTATKSDGEPDSLYSGLASEHSFASTKSAKSRKRPRSDTTSEPSNVPSSSKKPTRSILSGARPSSSGPNASASRCSASLTSGFRPSLSSAMPPPPVPDPTARKWSRTPPMKEYNFKRNVISVGDIDGSITFQESDVEETIEIATDWPAGEAAAQKGEPFQTTGYIGRGFTKRAIYARIGRAEFALVQNFDAQTTEFEVKKNLTGEYELLALCDWFKKKFDQYATKQNIVTIPKFYFNFRNSVLGTLAPLSSESCPLPFLDFIATPLLPSGLVDAKVKKFTGNDQFGEALDTMTKAVHAFVHFSVKYSKNHFLFCDLQGTLDAKGTWCLFDPQAHTNVSSPSHYWDLGSKAFGRIMDQHYDVCGDNWICNRLLLWNLDIMSARPQSHLSDDDPEGSEPEVVCDGLRTKSHAMSMKSILNATGSDESDDEKGA